jgi:hypothetical protein
VRALFRLKRLHKGLVEIKDVFEILDRIFLRLSENPGADQVEDHVANIFGGPDPPVGKDRYDHWPEFLERVLPHTFEQLRPRDVADRGALGLLLLLCRVIEGIPEEHIGVALVTRVRSHDRIKRFSESNFLHVVVPVLPGAGMISSNAGVGNPERDATMATNAGTPGKNLESRIATCYNRHRNTPFSRPSRISFMKPALGLALLCTFLLASANAVEPASTAATVNYQEAPVAQFEYGLVRVWNAKDDPPHEAGQVPEARLGQRLVVEVKNIEQWLCQNLEAGAWQTEAEVSQADPIVTKIVEDRKLWAAVRAGTWRESAKKKASIQDARQERSAEDNLQLLAAMKDAVGVDDQLLPARDETGAPLDPTKADDAGRILAACDKAFLFVKGLRDLKALQFITTINGTPLSHLPVKMLNPKRDWRRQDGEESAYTWWQITLRASDDPESDKAWSDLIRSVGSRFSLESKVSLSLPNELVALPTDVTTTAEDSRCRFVLIGINEAPRREKKLAKGEGVYPLALRERSNQIKRAEIVEVDEGNAGAPYVVHFSEVGGTKRYSSQELARLPPDPVPIGVIRIWNATKESPEWEQAQIDEVPSAKIGDQLVVEVRNFDGWLCNQIDQGLLGDEPLIQKASPELKKLITAKEFSAAVRVGGAIFQYTKTQITPANVVRRLKRDAATDPAFAALSFPDLKPLSKVGTIQNRSVPKPESASSPSAANSSGPRQTEAERKKAEQEQADQEAKKKKEEEEEKKKEKKEENDARNFLAPYREANALLRDMLKSKLRSLDLTINDLPLGITPDIADFTPIPESRRVPGDPEEDTYHWLRFRLTPRAKTAAKDETEKAADDPFKQLLAKPSFTMPSKVTLTLKSGSETLILPTAVTPQAKEKRCRFDLIGINKALFWSMLGTLVLIVCGLGTLAATTDILRDPCRRRPEGVEPVSLARSQMAFWFVVIAAAFFFLWIMTGNIATINGTCLILLAIGTSTAIGANAISRGSDQRKDLSDALGKTAHEMLEMTPLEMSVAIRARTEELEATKKALAQSNPNPAQLEEIERDLEILKTQEAEIKCFLDKQPGWLKPEIYFWWYRLRTIREDLLTEEAGTYDFHRFQILAWTIILGLMFVWKVFDERVMPTFDTNLLLLMGISSGAYLGFKKFAADEAKEDEKKKGGNSPAVAPAVTKPAP